MTGPRDMHILFHFVLPNLNLNHILNRTLEFGLENRVDGSRSLNVYKHIQWCFHLHN